MRDDRGHLPPMQLDVAALHAALREAFETGGVEDDPERIASAMMSSSCSISSIDPLRVAGAIHGAWTGVNAWRSGDPRAAARVVVATGPEAAALRADGVDATTAFAHAGRPDVPGVGLVVAVGCEGYDRHEMEAVLCSPDHVRVVLLCDASKLPRAA